MYAELHSLFMPGVSWNGGIVGLFKKRMVSRDFGRGSKLPFLCFCSVWIIQCECSGLKIAIGEP